MSYVQLFVFRREDQAFVPEDLLQHCQGTKTPIILFEKTNLKGKTDFYACIFNVLEHSYGYVLHTFYKHSLSVCSCRNIHKL